MNWCSVDESEKETDGKIEKRTKGVAVDDGLFLLLSGGFWVEPQVLLVRFLGRTAVRHGALRVWLHLVPREKVGEGAVAKVGAHLSKGQQVSEQPIEESALVSRVAGH